MKWIELAKSIYRLIADNKIVSLLNTTIRFVHQDKESHLSYAKHPEGVYAFVLYYRIRRSPEADKELEKFHHKFAEITLKLHGTFYLPYRHHYSLDQLERAYGRENLVKFMEAKQKFDPTCLFSSLWLRKYAVNYASDNYREIIMRESDDFMEYQERVDNSKKNDFEVPIVSERRLDSYHRLFKNSLHRRKFLEQFLQRVFHVEDPSVLYRLISRAIWDPKNKCDDIYVYLRDELSKYDLINQKITINNKKL